MPPTVGVLIIIITCIFLIYVFIREIINPVWCYYKSKEKNSIDIFYSKILCEKFNIKNKNIARIYIIVMVVFGYVCFSLGIIRAFYVLAQESI